MSLGESIGAMAGGTLGAIGGWIDADTQRKAIDKQQGAAKQNQDRFFDLFNTSKKDFSNATSGARDRLDDRESAANYQLQDFLFGESGIAKRTIRDVQTQGRRQAAASGLIGGGQESALVTPGIERAITNLGQVGSQAQLQFQQLFGGLNNNLDTAEMSGLANFTNSALSGASGAGQQFINTLSNFAQNPWAGAIAGNIAGSQTGQQVGKGFNIF